MSKLKILMSACSVIIILLLAKLSLAESSDQIFEIQPVKHRPDLVSQYPAVQTESLVEDDFSSMEADMASEESNLQ